MAISEEKAGKRFKKEFVPEDLEKLPEDKRAEVIDGKLYLLAAPSIEHQEISMFLSMEFYSYIREHKGKCKVYSAPVDVFLETARENDKRKRHVVQPDIVVICDPDKITKRGCKGAPDLVVEITSPSTAGRDYLQKMNLYRESGVREYWIVDPEMKTVGVYFFEKGIVPTEYMFTDHIPVNIYEDLSIRIEDTKETEK